MEKSNTTNLYRCEAFDAALQQDRIDLESFRQLCFGGVPEVKGLRSISWRLLLNYLPPEKNEWKEYISKQRKLYAQLTGNFVGIFTKKDFTRHRLFHHKCSSIFQPPTSNSCFWFSCNSIPFGVVPFSCPKTFIWIIIS